jgi:hypothetical protein
MDVTRHDSDFAFARTDDAGTVWTDKSGRFSVQIFPDLHHIQSGNTFGYANNHRDTRVGSFHDRIGCKCRRHVNYRRVRACLFHGISDGVEYGNALVSSSTFAGRNATNDIRSILNHLLSMKRTLFARESLDDKARILINENAQATTPNALE